MLHHGNITKHIFYGSAEKNVSQFSKLKNCDPTPAQNDIVSN